MDAVMVGSRMHRLDLKHRVEHDVDGLPAADASVHRVLPGHHRQPGPGIDVAREILHDRLEPLKPALPPGSVVGAVLVNTTRVRPGRATRVD